MSLEVLAVGRVSCRPHATMIVYVPAGVSLPGVVALLRSRGWKVRSVNELIRRVIASGPYEDAPGTLAALAERGVPTESIGVEVNLVCRPRRRAERSVAGRSSVRRRSGRSTFYAGVCGGRLFEAEAKRDIVVVKVGARTRARTLDSVPPESAFLHSTPPSRLELLEILECLFGGGES